MTQQDVQTVLVPMSAFTHLADSGIKGAEYAIRPVDKKHIEVLKGGLESLSFDQWPALEATEIDSVEGIIILDGGHRWELAKELAGENAPSTELPVNIRTYADDSAIVDAGFHFNIQHGKPLDATSRTRYGLYLYFTAKDAGETPSQREVAKRVGISHVTLNEAINKEEKKRAKAEKASTTTGEEGQEGEGSSTSSTSETVEGAKLIKRYNKITSELHDFTVSLDDDTKAINMLSTLLIEDSTTDLLVLEKMLSIVTKARSKANKSVTSKVATPATTPATTPVETPVKTKASKKSTAKADKANTTESPINQGFDNFDRSEYMNDYTA